MKNFPSISFIQRVVILFGVVFGLGYANGLNAQYFSPSNYPDSEYPYALPPASLSLPYSNVNSYAYYWDPATVFDVMTWDDADMYTPSGTSPDAGLVFTQRNPAGLPAPLVWDELSFPFAISLEAVILQAEPFSGVGASVPYVVASYYNTATQTFEVDIYEWDGANLIQVPGFPQYLAPSAAGGMMDFDYIRIDAFNQNQYGIVFCSDKELYAVSGSVGFPFYISNTLHFAQHPDFPNGYTQPDIALCKTAFDPAVPTSGLSEAVIVALDANRNQVGAFAFPYNDFVAASLPVTPYSIPTAVFSEPGVAASSRLQLPRIDALDQSPSSLGNVWSYVYLDETNDAEFVRAFMHDGVLSAPKVTRSLNDGLELLSSGYFLDNLARKTSSNTGNPQSNRKPIVALEKVHYAPTTDISDIGVFYGWYHLSGETLPNAANMSANRNDGYIGLKMNTFFEPLDFPSDTSYYVIPEPGTTMMNEDFPMPSLAFSTNNDPNLDYTLVAFSKQHNGNGVDNIGYKFQGWNFLSFRPAQIEEANTSFGFSAYPNPFTQTFQLKVAADDNQRYHLEVMDILGRTLLKGEGDIAALNALLHTQSSRWTNRQYILALTEAETGQKAVLHVVKQE